MFLGIKDDNKKIWVLKPKTYPNPAPCLKQVFEEAEVVCRCVPESYD